MGAAAQVMSWVMQYTWYLNLLEHLMKEEEIILLLLLALTGNMCFTHVTL